MDNETAPVTPATPPPVPANGAPVKAPAPVPMPRTASNLKIVRAEKKAGRLRIAVTGPSGSGKSYSSLLIAAGIVGKDAVRPDGTPKVLVVDTENASMADYGQNADGSWPVVPFDMISLEPEYTVAKYLESMKMAVEGGYECIVIDSGSHAWAGKGGLLDQKNKLDAGGRGNSYVNWGKMDPAYNAFRDMILQNPLHLIMTMRSKTEYIFNEADKKVTRAGMAPVMRDGMEYEFTVVFDLDIKHQADISKHRTGALYADRSLFVPTVETGRELISWRMAGGQEAEPVAAPAPDNGTPVPGAPWVKAVKPIQPVPAPAVAGGQVMRATTLQMGEITRLCAERKVTLNRVRAAMGLPILGLITTAVGDSIIARLKDAAAFPELK